MLRTLAILTNAGVFAVAGLHMLDFGITDPWVVTAFVAAIVSQAAILVYSKPGTGLKVREWIWLEMEARKEKLRRRMNSPAEQ